MSELEYEPGGQSADVTPPDDLEDPDHWTPPDRDLDADPVIEDGAHDAQLLDDSTESSDE